MLTDEEIFALYKKQQNGDAELRAIQAIREAVRMTAERCAEICEKAGDDMKVPEWCAAEIRERMK